MSALADAAGLAGRPTFIGLCWRCFLATALYGPGAFILAIANGLALALFFVISGRVSQGLPLQATEAAVPWLALILVSTTQATWFGLVYGAMASARRPWPERVAATGRSVRRGLPFLSIGMALTCAIGAFWPWAALAIWAVATFLVLPAHFAEHGVSGLSLAPRTTVPAVLRLLLMAPTTAFLALVISVLFRPGVTWGFMEGGLFLFPILCLTGWWASFSCVVLSVVFTAPAKPAAGS